MLKWDFVIDAGTSLAVRILHTVGGCLHCRHRNVDMQDANDKESDY